MRNYHKILSTILNSYVQCQGTLFNWNIQTSQTNLPVKFIFPLCLCVVDIKGAHALCGMYDKYSNVSRPCVSCYCVESELDDYNKTCENVLHKDMLSRLEKNDKDVLKMFSQHHNMLENAFFNVDMAGWKFGIWGLCPAEILHQFYEGLVLYAIEYFMDSFLTPTYVQAMNRSVQKIMMICKRQSDQSFPQANFSFGVSHYKKMKGTEKFACIFYLALYLHTKQSSIDLKQLKKADELLKWRNLFEQMLYFKEWVMKTKHRKSDVRNKKLVVRKFMKNFKELVNRDNNGLKIPKFHELLHVCRDILRHGPALGFDTCPTESNHRFTKNDEKKTQRIKSRFEFQTANRLYERNVIYTAYNDVQQNHLFSKHEQTNNDSSLLSGKFFIHLAQSTDERQILRIANKNLETIRICSGDYREKLYEDILQFLDKYFALHGIYNITKTIPCYTRYKRLGILFYGVNWKEEITDPKENWCLFSWDSDNGDNFIVPGQCILFFHLEGISNTAIDDGTYVLIRSFKELHPINSFIQYGDICGKEKFHIVNVETMYDSAFVIPDIGNKTNSQKFLFLPSRDNWEDNFCG